MVKILTSAVVLALLGACDQSGTGHAAVGSLVGVTYPPGWVPNAPSVDATYSLSITNYDDAEYSVWVQWQDDLGRFNQEFVVSLRRPPPGSFSHAIQGFQAKSGAPYVLVLMDAAGALIDAAPIPVLASGEVIPLSFTVMGGFLSSP
jgi:hypothetical protein